jgi:transcription antitermination factor NusG
VVQTKTNQSALAAKTLREAGFVVYNPLILRRLRAGRSRVQLFPNYMFVKFIAGRWFRAKSVRGVAHIFILAGGERPALVSDLVIRALRARENEHGLIDLSPSRLSAKQLNKGDLVSILVGPYASLQGLYEGQSGKDRALVLLTMLGSLRCVEVLEGDLRAAA